MVLGGVAPSLAIAATPGGGSQTTSPYYQSGTVSGRVKSTTGNAAKGVQISLVKGDSILAWYKPTNSQGKFATKAYLTQTTKAKLGVNRFSGESKYVGGYWAGNGKRTTTSYAKAKSITLARGKSVSGIKPVVSTCATVSGTVKNADKYTRVVVFNDKNKSLVTRSDIHLGKNGTYTVRGLAKGKYYLAAVQDTHVLHQLYESYYGTKGAKKPSKPNVTIKSCTNIKNLNIKAKKVITLLKDARITGSAKVGGRLTVNPGKYSKSGLKISYQWYRETYSNVNGIWVSRMTKIKGATSKYYTVKRADLGQDLVAKVIVRKAGHKTLVTDDAVSVPQAA